MFFTDNQIKEIASLVEKYVDVFEHPDKNNNIIIENNLISIIKDGKTVCSKRINPHDLKNQIEQITYGEENIFKNNNSPFSPLDADRKENKIVWKKNYNKINFPKFIPVFLLSLLLTDKIPSVIDFCYIYANAYTEPIPYDEISDNRLSLYREIFINNKNDHERLDKITQIDNQSMINILIRFKDKYYKNYIYGLPINEFSLEHLAYRIYKVYGSIVRDVFNALYISTFDLSIQTSYSLNKDLNGVDLYVNEIPIYAFTKTSEGDYFSKIKKNNRHKLKFGIRLIADLSNKKSGIYLITDDAVNQIIDIVKNKTIDKSLDKFYNVEF